MSAFRVPRPALFLIAALLSTVALSSAQEEATGPSLYERLGGLAPISVVVSDFIDAVVVDDVINANPAVDAARQVVPAAYLKYHVTAMVCQATGGPCQYNGRGMLESHAHLGITEAEWDRMVELFLGVLAGHGVPEAETGELVAIVGTTKGDIVQAGM
jgi:hemoglobin